MEGPFTVLAEEQLVPSLGDLTDVNLTSSVDGHELRFNSTTSRFENTTPHAVYDSSTESLSIGSTADVTLMVDSVAIGSGSLESATASVDDCIAIGDDALKSATGCLDNVAIGSDCLEANIVGNNNTGVGKKVLSTTVGSDNTGFGKDAGRNTVGSENTFVGSGAGVDFVSGDRNILIGKDTGKDAGAGNGTGSNNLIIGNGVPAVQNSKMMVLFNGELTDGDLPSTLIGDNVMVLGGTNIQDAILCGGSLPTSSTGRKPGALFTDPNGFVRSNITSPNDVQTITQPTSTLDTLKVECTNGDCVLKLSSEVDGNDATLTASHTDNSLTIAATQSANIVFKTNGSEGLAVMNNQDVRFKNFIRWTGSFSNVSAAGTPSTRSMAWIGNDLGIYDTTNGWRKVSTESF
jgi:hypothetical protein